MVGGRVTGSEESEHTERIFNGEFPEKPGALLDFLKHFGTKWNISLFHYRNIGSAYGNILIGIEDQNKNKSLLLKHLDKSGTLFKEESNNRAYLDFLK
jgi:threonine dehydratase